MGQFTSQCNADEMAGAATKLMGGKLVAFPTETVYGLGADACNADAVARIYSVKGRPADHPLIVHVGSMDALGDWADDVPEYAIVLARDFWPGPMTLVFKRSHLAKDFVTGGQDTVGVRVPNHPVALALLEAFEQMGGHGIAAPSANRFGNVSPTTAQAVASELGEYLRDEDVVLDGGTCEVGVESTIIDCTGKSPRILRPGAITEEMIRGSTGITELLVADYLQDHLQTHSSQKVITPRVSGSLEKHYAPVAKVILDIPPKAGQGFVALSHVETPAGVIRLASPKNIIEFAHDLYSSLRKADELGLAEVVIEQPQGDGLVIAIRDRLQRASKGR